MNEHLLAVSLGLAVPEDQHAGGKTGAIENVLPKADHRFENVHLQELAPDLAFLGHAEQHAMGKHHGHAAGFAGHGLDHVLDPGEVADLAGGSPAKLRP